MSYFTAKMHQIRFKGRGGKGKGGEGNGWDWRGGEGMGWDRRGGMGGDGMGGKRREGKGRKRRVPIPKLPPLKNPRSATGIHCWTDLLVMWMLVLFAGRKEQVMNGGSWLTVSHYNSTTTMWRHVKAIGSHRLTTSIYSHWPFCRSEYDWMVHWTL